MTEYYLGLDWGKAKIGIAVADAETRMAFAHSVTGNDASVFGVLRKLCQERAVRTVVIGVPSDYAYAAAVGDEARVFGEKVGKECDVSVVFHKEMFTTKMAQANLSERGKMSGQDDAEAARLILQSWLDTTA